MEPKNTQSQGNGNGFGFAKPELPFGLDALEPHISKETLEFHFGKHHLGYYGKLTKALGAEEHADKRDKNLEWFIKNTQGNTSWL